MLKYLAMSILLNILVLGLFYLFVMQPIQVISKSIAKSWCESLKLECQFK